MGQYYYVVNITKKEMLHPHKFDDGLKLLEFGCSSNGTMTALALLLADGNGRGGGDLMGKNDKERRLINKWVGRWAGDKIVIAGDYANEGKFTNNIFRTLHDLAGQTFIDVSENIIKVMKIDSYIKEDLDKSHQKRSTFKIGEGNK